MNKVLKVSLFIVSTLIVVEGASQFYMSSITYRSGRVALPANQDWKIVTPAYDGLDAEIRLTNNGLGFRGTEKPSDLSERLSIVTVGGRSTENKYLDNQKTWTARLGKTLTRNFPDLWINNAGLEGHSTFGHAFLFADHLARLKPKVVVLMAGVDDFKKPGASPRERHDLDLGIDFSSARAAISSLAQYSGLARLGLYGYRRFTVKRLNTKRYSGQVRKTAAGGRWGTKHVTWEEAHYGPDDPSRLNFTTPKIAKLDFLSAHQEKATRFAKKLSELVLVARTNGMMLILVTHPVLFGKSVDENTGYDLARIRVQPGIDGETWGEISALYNNAVRGVASQMDVLLIDAEKRMARSSRYFHDRSNFTNEGARVLAQIIYPDLCTYLEVTYPAHGRGNCPE